MKQFIINLILFTIVLYLITLCFDKIVTNGLRQSETIHFNNLTKINQGKINADLIINGSSKALVQIDPSIIDSVLGINSYNLGLDGSPFIPQRAQYELYRLSNPKPKVIVQIVSNGTLRSLQEGFNLPIKFAPYLDIPEVRKLMKLTSSFSYTDYSVPMIRYSGKPMEIIIGGLAFFDFQILTTTEVKGYSPSDSSWPESTTTVLNDSQVKDSTNFKLDPNIELFTTLDSISTTNFEEFLAQCTTENIIVFLVYPPIYFEDVNTIKHLDYYSRIANKHNAYFLDYSQDSRLAYDKNKFYDAQHLNLDGATQFTKILSEDIKSRIANTIFNN